MAAGRGTKSSKRSSCSLGAMSPDAEITLRAVDSDNVRDVCRLAVTPDQEQFVAPNAVSMAEYAVTDNAWTRAVYADEELVGYVLLSDDEEQPRYYLWRFMIDQRYQGLGFGKRATDLVVDYVRTRPGADGLYVSYVPGDGSPEHFYKKFGFVDTGVVHGGEVEALLTL